jgi:NAD(P)-dependent dehydrogenase (short-subunit alcohol dehydrogenase family)
MTKKDQIPRLSPDEATGAHASRATNYLEVEPSDAEKTQSGIERAVAPAYVFLASKADPSYITGTVLQVMGGEMTGG